MNSSSKNNSLFFKKELKIIYSVTTIAVMGVAVIAPALPVISAKLNISIKETALLITAFTFPGIILSPIMGILADRTGRKRILVPSLILFGIAGTACAFTDNFLTLILFRFLQGSGAASIGTLNLTIIGDTFSGKERIKAMGYNGTIMSISTGLYPSIGGAIALLGWNYPFLLSILALPVAWIVFFKLKNPEPEQNQHIIEYMKGAFKLLKNFRILSLYFSIMATFIILYGFLLTFFPFFMRESFSATPLSIGLIISSASIATALGSFNLSKLSEIFSSEKLILTAFILYAVGMAVTINCPNIYTLVLPAFLFGFANGINIPNSQAMISGAAPMEYRGAFMSINSMVLRIGQTVGPVVSGIIFHSYGSRGILLAGAIFPVTIFILLFIAFKKSE